MGTGLAVAAFAVALALFGLGMAYQWLFGQHEDQRYLNPQLHEGVWHREPVRPGDGAVVWQAVLAPHAHPDVGPRHRHRVQQCTITDAMAHVDVCWCGKTRYGVYGSWS